MVTLVTLKKEYTTQGGNIADITPPKASSKKKEKEKKMIKNSSKAKAGTGNSADDQIARLFGTKTPSPKVTHIA